MRLFRILNIVLFMIVGLMEPGLLFSETVQEKPKVVEKVVEASEDQKTTLIELFSWATVLPKALIDLQAKVDNEQEVLEIEQELPKLIIEVEQLQWDANAAGTNPDIQLMEISTYQNKVHRIGARLNSLRKPITDTVTDFSAERTKWQEKQSKIESFRMEDIDNFSLAKEQLKILNETIATAFEIIEKRLALALKLGKKLGDVQIRLHGVELNLKGLSEEKITDSIHQTSPSMLSLEFYEKLKPAILQKTYSNIALEAKEQRRHLQEHRRLVLLTLIVLLVIAFMIRQTRRLTPSTSHWYPFATCYMATALFMATSFHGIMDMMGETVDLPNHWQSIFHIFMLLAVIRLTRYLVHSKWQRGLFIPLSAFMILLVIMVIVDLPQIFMLLYVFYVSLTALLFYLLRLPATRRLSGKEAWAWRTLGLLPAVVVVSGMFGYDQFAVIIFATVLSAITASLIIWVLYTLCIGILDFLLIVVPSTLLNENREKIVSRVKPIVASLHILLLVAVQMVIWDSSGTVSEAMGAIFKSGIEFGGLNITPGFIIIVCFIIYSTLLISRGLQTLLLSKVLPGYGAEKGVQLSIARLVHYAILMIGFLVILRVLGFELNQLALLGGALGVGIGFGLQAIVNNFASGLILLFERPIKVGDTIEIGTELGEVKNMGLRATIIQTFDNAEIVVPNSDLITGQVTNWTLAERKARVRVNVGVAYGTDVDQVLKILLGCANSNPMVLNNPPPVAFFIAFGASSLDFQLRVWIPEFLNKTQVLSDLNQDVENEFAINDIEVPFPQTDLHLRSVDATAAEQLARKNSNER